jgi:hypothetical protein
MTERGVKKGIERMNSTKDACSAGSQKLQILQALKRGPLTPHAALSLFGCFRLAARVAELRQEGHQIHTKRAGKSQYAVYKLVRSR